MSKKILVIESDAAFAKELSDSFEGKGFEVHVTGDGKDGLERAKNDAPDLIVLCVELPKTSGYSICNKLKKDDQLKSVPLVIISAEATPETFEQHKKLKTRAEDYLIKPFAPEAIIEKVGALIGLPQQASDDEVVALDDEAGLSDLSEDIVAIEDDDATTVAAAPLDSPIKKHGSLDDDADLKALDDAFEGLSDADAKDAKREPTEDISLDVIETDHGVSGADLDAAAASVESSPLDATGPLPRASDADAALDSLASEAFGGDNGSQEMSGVHGVGEYMAKVAELEEKLAQTTAELEQLKAAPSSGGGGSSKDVIALKTSLNNKDKEILKLKQELNSKETELIELKERDTENETKANAADEEIKARDGEIKVLKGKLEGFSMASKKLESELKNAQAEQRAAKEKAAQAEKEAGQAQSQVEGLERQLADKSSEAADSAGKVEALEKELETIRAESESSRGELEQARAEHESLRAESSAKIADLTKRVAELEATVSRNEERVVKAYQKIKGDEKLREKTKKALAIALQLLEEHGQQADALDKDART